jgi:ABC-type sugar transport system permease subunit
MIITKKTKITESLIYILPSIILIIFVFFFPLIMIIKYSFFGADNSKFIFTLDNYKGLFKSDMFVVGLKNNFLLLAAVPIIIILSIFFAALLYEKIGGWKFYRFIVFLPYVLPITVVGIVFVYIFQLEGIFNFILKKIGLGFMAIDWFGNPKIAIWTIMIIIIWKELGFSTVLILARMMSINQDLYDAAEIDGCNWFQRHINVTIPQSITTLGFLVTINIITMLAWVFNYVYVTTHGGPNISTMVAEMAIYKYEFRFNNIAMASSASFILFLITIVFIVIQSRIRMREIE